MFILYFVDNAVTTEQANRAIALRAEKSTVQFRNGNVFRLDEFERCDRVILSAAHFPAIASAYIDHGIEIENDAPPNAPAAVDDAVAAAFEQMESDPLAWTDGGLPKTGYLSRLLGRSVSAAERGEWWAAYQVTRAADDGANT